MSTHFFVIPSNKKPLLSFLESVKSRLIIETSESQITNEAEVETFIKEAENLIDGPFLDLMKFLFSYKEKLLKDHKLFLNAMNIVSLHIRSEQDENQRNILINEYLSQVNALPEAFFSLKARMLAVLFNALGANDPKQFELFKEIVKLADSNQKISIILPTIENIEEYFRLWGYSDDFSKQREIYHLILNALLTNKREKIAIDIFVKYLQTFEKEHQDLSNPQETAFIVSNIKRFLVSDNIHSEIFENIINLKRVFNLEDKRLSDLLVFYIHGDLNGFLEWRQKNENYLNELGIDAKQIERKIRIKCLACFEDTGKAISFKAMAEKLMVSEEQVEDWVIMGIQNKIVGAKIDEFNK